MKINVLCDNNSDSEFILSCEQVSIYAQNLLNFVIKNTYTKDFSGKFNYEFEVLITNNDFIHQVNKEYRKKDSATDVITFALYVDSEDKIIIDNTIQLGQIIISSDKVFEQAKDNNVSDEYEFLNLLSHGILHLLGFVHDSETEPNYMLNLQSKMIEDVTNVKI